MSAGMRSGVNWMRPNSTARTRPRVARSLVFPRPGTPSSSTWPSHKAPIRTVSTKSLCPTITLPTSVLTAEIASANCWGVISSFMGSSWLEIREVVADDVSNRGWYHERVERPQRLVLVFGEPVGVGDEGEVLHSAAAVGQAPDLSRLVAASEIDLTPFSQRGVDRVEHSGALGRHLGVFVPAPSGSHSATAGTASRPRPLLAAGALAASATPALPSTLSLALALAFALTSALAGQPLLGLSQLGRRPCRRLLGGRTGMGALHRSSRPLQSLGRLRGIAAAARQPLEDLGGITQGP